MALITDNNTEYTPENKKETLAVIDKDIALTMTMYNSKKVKEFRKNPGEATKWSEEVTMQIVETYLLCSPPMVREMFKDEEAKNQLYQFARFMDFLELKKKLRSQGKDLLNLLK